MNCRRFWAATLRHDCRRAGAANVLRFMLRLTVFGAAMLLGLVLALVMVALGAGPTPVIATILAAAAMGAGLGRQAVG